MKIFFIFLIHILLIGCNQQAETNIERTSYVQDFEITNTGITTDQQGTELSVNNKQDNARKAVNLLLQQEEVKRVRVVEGKEVIIAAIELKHWYTFQSKKLTKEFKKKLEEELPSKKIEATTDHKIYLELEKLEKKIINNDISKKEIDKKLKKIQKLMKEQT